jgi:hypothetical protein
MSFHFKTLETRYDNSLVIEFEALISWLIYQSRDDY